MIKSLFVWFFVIFLIIRCTNEPKTDSKSRDSFIGSKQITSVKKESIGLNFIKRLKIKNLPYQDSTNFDNYQNQPKLSDSEIDFLNLKSKIKSGNSFSSNYRINFSDDFYALIITYKKGDSELFTSLITYDKNFNMIDYLDIAYDEIAESWLRTESYISNEIIKVDEINYITEKPTIERNLYKVTNHGKILKLK